MLQAMSAQINGLSSRMETMEKKSEAAHERASLGEQLPEGQNKTHCAPNPRKWKRVGTYKTGSNGTVSRHYCNVYTVVP